MAQPLDTAWTRTYVLPLDQHTYAAARSSDGGAVIAGATGEYGYEDVYVACLNVDGDTLWTISYGTNARETANDIAACRDGGWVLAGQVHHSGFDANMFLLKLDSTGQPEWWREYDAGLLETSTDVLATADGGYIVSGDTWWLGAGLGDIYIVKTDSVGNEEWNRRYGWPYNDVVYDALQAENSGYLFVGSSNVEWGNRNGILLRTDANGDTLWVRTPGGVGDDDLNAVAPCVGGGYIVCGQLSAYANYNSADAWLAKFDDNGDALWERTYGGEWNDWPMAIQQTADSGYLVAGWTQSFQVLGTKMYAFCTDLDGDTLWTGIFGTQSEVRAQAIQEISNGDYLLIGYTNPGYLDSTDIYVVKISQNTDVVSEPNSTLIPGVFDLSVYPNPFNSTVTIRYQLSSPANVRVNIFNLLGEEIAVLQDRRQSAGAHSMTWSPDVSSGIYFVSMEAGGAAEMRKLVYLK